MDQAREIKKVLYVTLSNLGDALMGLPAFDYLRRECPTAKITVVAAPRTRCLFEHHPQVDELIIFDKQAPLSAKIDLFFRFRKEHFDVIVDLKNTFYRFALKSPRKNPGWLAYPSWVRHSSQEHLYKAIVALKGGDVSAEEFDEINSRRNPAFISADDRRVAQQLLEKKGIAAGDRLVLIAPGARSDLKKWPPASYAEVARGISAAHGFKIGVVGAEWDRAVAGEIIRFLGGAAVDLTGETAFGSLAALAQRAALVISNDSGLLHLASYLNTPTIGIYGPSDHVKYGPWSKSGCAVRKNVLCAPCGKAACSKERVLCLETVKPYDVLLAVRLLLAGEESRMKDMLYRRILVSRTDRIGDVLISTPVLESLRERYPASYLAVMVSPYTKDLVEGNPYVDEVVVFDKDKITGLRKTLAFSRQLSQKAFDVAVILHPTVRVHLLCFLAGIKERIGYNRKTPFLLTKTIPHKKQEGVKHELEYNYDLLKLVGVSEVNHRLYMPIRPSSEEFVEDLLRKEGMSREDRIVAVSPAASCISRRWSIRKFAEVIDRLEDSCGVKVVIVADTIHKFIAQELVRLSRTAPKDFSGRLNLSQLASLFRRSALVISNDSGPVHMAVAVGTPVISIFGRNQPGLSPKRWGPLGASDVVLHKKTDCSVCLAHACENDFKCLEAITVEEVVFHAEKILEPAS